jgi:YhcH/YjgK/YiaL family protein
MITDTIENTKLYKGLGERFEKAFEYLKNTDFSKLENDKYEVYGKDVYAIVNSYTTKSLTEGKFEAHEKYADIQFIVSGVERLYYTQVKETTPIDTYNTEKDIIFLHGNGNYITAYPGTFVIFFPTDAHMPNITNDIPVEVKKVVMKVRV